MITLWILFLYLFVLLVDKKPYVFILLWKIVMFSCREELL